MTTTTPRLTSALGALLIFGTAVQADDAAAALIDPDLGPVVIHEGVDTIPPHVNNLTAIRHNDTALNWVEAGVYGQYNVVNNTTDLDILGFAVSNPESEIAFVLSGSSWTGWNLDADSWNQPKMFSALLAQAYSHAMGVFVTTAYTPGVVFGSYESNFGDEAVANLFYTTDTTGIIGPGETLGGFYFGPDRLASSFVAFAIPAGSFPSGVASLSPDDIHLIRGTAVTAVPLPATAWMLLTGIGCVVLRRARRAAPTHAAPPAS